VQESFQALRQKVISGLGPIKFVFVSIKLSPSRLHIRQRIELTNQLIQAELADWPGASYIDVYQTMLGVDGQPRRELFAEDGLHLSLTGYRLWARVLKAESYKFV
jgi:lysophospholipase L1-like esterase